MKKIFSFQQHDYKLTSSCHEYVFNKFVPLHVMIFTYNLLYIILFQ